MSYASRLVQMSRPVATVAAPEAASIAEAHDEVVVDAPAVHGAPAVESQPRTTPAVRTHEHTVQTLERRVERETVERTLAPQHDVVVVEAPEPRAPARAPVPWQAEDPAGDPLEKVEASDDLRTLLRAVRAWTASPPAPIEPAHGEPTEITNVTVAEPVAAVVVPREQAAREVTHEESMQVSIGNVTITVEDAPAPRGATRPKSPRLGETASRLARHYVRGR